MRILVVTELVDKNHDMFGFFHGRLIDFAQGCQKVTIICLELREHNLPSDIKILSLGKEKRKSRIVYTLKLLKYIRTPHPALCRTRRLAMATARKRNRALVQSYIRRLVALGCRKVCESDSHNFGK